MTSGFALQWGRHSGNILWYRGSCRTSGDLSAGFHGKIHDSRALSECLGLAVDSDGVELIVAAYRRWGIKAADHVLGEWSAVVVDRERCRAVLMHDSLGLGLLYLSLSPDGGTAASHLEDIAALERRDIDEGYLLDYLRTGYYTTAATPYVGVQRLLPGCAIEVGVTQCREHRLWSVAEIATIYDRSEANLAEEMRDLLDRAVKASAETVGGNWVSLSGGLDSSTIACIAAVAGTSGLGAYSIFAPGHPDSNEQQWMEAVVEHHGIDWHPVDGDDILPFSELPTFQTPEPSVSVIDSLAIRTLNAMCRDHDVSTLMTGSGGDVLLGTYLGSSPVHLSDGLFDGTFGQSLRALGAWQRECHVQRPLSYWAWHGMVKPAVAHVFHRPVSGSQHPPLPFWFSAEARARTGRPAHRRMTLAPRARTPGRQYTADLVWAGAMGTAGAPRRELAYQRRAPLLYRPLVEFLVGLPWDMKIRPRCDRYLQRRALEGILPEKVRRRAVKTAGSWSLIEGLRKSHLWQDYLCDDPQLAKIGLVDRNDWRLAVAQAAHGQTHGDMFLLSAVAIEVWLKGRAGIDPVRGHVPPS